MIFTSVDINFSLFVPIAIAIITAIIGPIWLSRHKETIEERNKRLDTTGELSVRIIDEGRDMRAELRQRIDDLESRIATTTQAFQEALDEIRRLKSENERCTNLIEELRKEVEKHRAAMSLRVEALEHPEIDVVAEKAKQKIDDRITQLEENGDSNGSV